MHIRMLFLLYKHYLLFVSYLLFVVNFDFIYFSYSLICCYFFYTYCVSLLLRYRRKTICCSMVHVSRHGTIKPNQKLVVSQESNTEKNRTSLKATREAIYDYSSNVQTSLYYTYWYPLCGKSCSLLRVIEGQSDSTPFHDKFYFKIN